MLDKKQLKVQGLRYARSLQVVIRTVTMLSVDHRVAAGPLQASFDALNNLVKQTNQFTLGFVENRIMLNNILTTDPGLAQLENDLLKRGIGAVTFEAGLTLARYKQAVAVLSTPTKQIEEMGGPAVLIAQNLIEGVRIFPAGKNQQRTESGDTLLETDAEQFLMTKDAQAGVMPPFFAGMESISMLLESACIERPPEDFRGGPSDIMRLIGPTVEAALVDHRGDPQKSYVALARILQDLKPDMVMSAFPAARQQELKDAPPEQIAGEFIEDTAIQWAVQKLASAPVGTEAIVVEEDVVRVLVRSLQATRMANRMATKLAKFVQEHVFPPTTYKRIQEELKWVGLPTKQKLEELMKLERYGLIEFRRMVELLRDLLKDQKAEEATQLAARYFNVLEAKEILPEELGRGPELLAVMAPVRTSFAPSTAERLCAALLREDLNQFVHFQVANCMVALSKAVAIYEDYGIVQRIGAAMEKSAPRDPALHLKCCQGGLPQLLPEKAMERMVELLLEKRDDAAWVKSALMMIRWSGALGIEKLFALLEREGLASNRMVLMRFIGQMGASALDAARLRLQHKQWYVVRNACKLLGDLKDPDLLQDLAPALQHADERVQQAALAAINKNRVPGRAQAIAEALPCFGPHTVDQVLEELMFLRDPVTLPALERFILLDARGKHKAAEKAVQAVAGQQSEQAMELLGNFLADPELEMPVRRAALHALRSSKSEAARRALTTFVEKAPDDPLAREGQKALTAAGH